MGSIRGEDAEQGIAGDVAEDVVADFDVADVAAACSRGLDVDPMLARAVQRVAGDEDVRDAGG